jgi:hypothetical protein
MVPSSKCLALGPVYLSFSLTGAAQFPTLLEMSI